MRAGSALAPLGVKRSAGSTFVNWTKIDSGSAAIVKEILFYDPVTYLTAPVVAGPHGGVSTFRMAAVAVLPVVSCRRLSPSGRQSTTVGAKPAQSGSGRGVQIE